MTALRISLNACVSGLCAGQMKVQEPHSQHSIPFNFSNKARSFLSAAPVSYTHLDVYKRQVMICVVTVLIIKIILGK